VPNGKEAAMTASALLTALGGRRTVKKPVRSDLDLIALAGKGIPSAAAARVVETGLLSPEELDHLVIPRRTFARRHAAKHLLTAEESDRLLRVVRMIVRAVEALGDSDKAASWLRRANKSLGGRTPISLLASDLGARLVEQILGRIEYGVYS
jgi:putative toxin-antitoxin system antitoxin component (TIGR02293 family)